LAKFCPRCCWMTPKLFFTQIEFLVFDALWFISVSYSDWIAQVHSTKSWLFLTKNLTIFWITESGNTLLIQLWRHRITWKSGYLISLLLYKQDLYRVTYVSQFCPLLLFLFWFNTPIILLHSWIAGLLFPNIGLKYLK
jgi:hypothetical protein